jgi:hypothetical protein
MKKILFIILVLVAKICFSQNGYDWGKDKPQAESRFTFVKLYYNSPQYLECKPQIQWLCKEAPNLHKDLYVMGAEVYRKATEETKDSIQKIAFQDSTLYMYRQQINRFNLKAEGYNYMSKVAYTYLSVRPNQWDTIAAIYNKCVELNDTNTFVENIYFYMAANSVMKQIKKLDDLQYLEKYQKVVNLLAYQKRKYKTNTQMLAYIDNLNTSCTTMFNQYLTLTCDNISKVYDFDALTLDQAKRAQQIMISSACTKDAKYLKVLVRLYELEKNDEHTKALADYYYSNDLKTKAVELYQDIITTSTDKTYKGASSYVLMAYYTGNKEKVRSYARTCINNNYQVKAAYETIGDLYQASLNDCRDKDDIVKTRAIYIAAYNNFKLAGNSAKMAKAKEQFPSTEELFVGNHKVGQVVNTGCWINEDVVLQSR